MTKPLRDVKFWLGNSNGDVNVVLTLSLQRQDDTVEKWDLGRSADPVPSQNMEIVRTSDGPRITGEIKIRVSRRVPSR